MDLRNGPAPGPGSVPNPPSGPAPLVEARGLRAGYGSREVLHGVDLAVGAGELVGLLGPNGGGKSTLLLALSGVLAPRGGQALLSGRDLAGMAPRDRARLAACVPQRSERPVGLSVAEVVLMGRYPHLSLFGGYAHADREAARRAMDRTGLADLAGRPVAELSGGEFQRVLLARALAQEAGLLLLDEATASMDMARRMEVFDLLAERCGQGLGVLAAIHDLNLAALYCRRLVFLKNGRVVLHGPTARVFTSENLTEIYETPILVAPHPAAPVPQAHCLPGGGPSGGPSVPGLARN